MNRVSQAVSRIFQLNNEYDIDALLNETKNAIINSLYEKKDAKSKIYKRHSDNSVKNIRNVCNWKNRSAIPTGLYDLTCMNLQELPEKRRT